jgi:hypothetical protein
MNTENFTELKLHKFFLTFYDRKDKIDYQIKRNPEIVIISSLFLLQRIFNLIILIINFYGGAQNNLDPARLYLNAVGIAIHLAFLLPLLFGKIRFWQTIHASVVVLSFQTYMFNQMDAFKGF